jgi:acyl-CoA thioester hydrolase
MQIKEEKFKNRLPLQVRFNDIDAMGHINNNVYFSFYDLGKIEYLDCMKAGNVSWTDGEIVIARTETDFLRPVFYAEPIAVETKITRLGEKSGTFLQQIINTETGEIKSRCLSIFVYFDAKSMQSLPVPDNWRSIISAYEGL